MIKRSLLALCLIAAAVIGAQAQGFVATQNLNVEVTDNSGNPVTTAAGSTVNLNNRILQRSTYNIVCDGDSITVAGPFGAGGTQWIPGYCGDVAFSLSQTRAITVTYNSFGMDGYSWNYSYSAGDWPPGYTINSTAPTVVDSQAVSGMTNVLIGFAGTNGIFLGGHTAATEFAGAQAWLSARQATGVWNYIVLVTMYPRQGSAPFEAQRTPYNADLRSLASPTVLIADAGADIVVGCAGCEDNTNCFLSDKIHPTGIGFTCGGIAGGGMNYLATQLIVPLLP